MANRLPIPRIERRSRDSLLYDAEEGCFPRIVGRAGKLTAEECNVYCVPPGSWDDDESYPPSREAAEAAIIRRRFGEDRDVAIVDRRKTR